MLLSSSVIGSLQTKLCLDKQDRLLSDNEATAFRPAPADSQMGELATPEQYAAWAAGVSAPARVIYGDSDRITPLFPNSSRLMRHLQHAELTVVKEASHQVMQEKPESVNAVLLDLLAENTSK